jgi:hypothetical protein
MRRSSTKEQPEPVFFTDRDLGPTVAALLKAGGWTVEAYHQHFALDNVPDGEWLKFIGSKGWIALSHNKRIRYERGELEDLMTAGIKAFFVIGKGPHPALAAALLRNAHKIKRLIRKVSEPFVAKVYQERDDVEIWITYQQWMEGRRIGRW